MLNQADIDKTREKLREAVGTVMLWNSKASAEKTLAQKQAVVDLVTLDDLTNALDALIAFEVTASHAVCERRTKTGTCIDKRYSSPCGGCKAEATLAAIIEQTLTEVRE